MLCVLDHSFPQYQIEFYFGDANLPKDKYLQQKISENEDGCMYFFNSMTTHHYQGHIDPKCREKACNSYRSNR